MENFETFKLKLEEITKNAFLKTGIRSDIIANFKTLRTIEDSLKSIGVKTSYYQLSPKLNTASIIIEMVNPELNASIRANKKQMEYFESLDNSYRGSRGYVDFDFGPFYSDFRYRKREDYSLSILDYLREELSLQEEQYFSLSRYHQELTAMNIIIAFLDKALSGSDDDKETLMELLLNLNLKIILAPKELFKRVVSLEDRILVVKKLEPYESVPDYYLDSRGKTSSARLLVNEIYIWNKDEGDMELVTNSEQAVVVLDEAVKGEREEMQRSIDKVWNDRI